MSYIEDRRSKAINSRSELFDDKNHGIYKGKEREFVLSQPVQNLWHGIRQEAMDYFNENKITWWGNKSEPSGHLLSSQIACLNHLFILRNNEEYASSIIRKINPEFSKACILDSGFVEFEVIGKENYLKEKSHNRGIYATSIDAMMLAEKQDGSRILICIEWKFTEFYKGDSLAAGKPGITRLGIYSLLLNDPNSPILNINYADLYYEPYYQLMRQTLLAWKMSEAGEYGSNDWIHLHVIPEGNLMLRNTNTSPGLKGETMHQSWTNVLKQPPKYKVIDPEELLTPISDKQEQSEYINYLRKRYWE